MGTAAAVIAIVVFKLTLAGPNWLTPSLEKNAVMEKLTDVPRLALIFRTVAEGTVRFGGWPVNHVLLAVAGLSLRKVTLHRRRVLRRLVGIIAFALGCDLAIYLLAPNIQWLMDTSRDRLLLQLWPVCIFVSMAAWASEESPEQQQVGGAALEVVQPATIATAATPTEPIVTGNPKGGNERRRPRAGRRGVVSN